MLFLFVFVIATETNAQNHITNTAGNFGLPGILDLPTAKRFADGELFVTHQNHKYLFMTGISFQALPRLGVSFRYGGQGLGGGLAQNRVNWDRSFDAHLSILDEGKYFPAISIGLRDFIGTGWYSSEYIVGTKTFGNLEITSGLGFGRLAGRNSFYNPLAHIFSSFEERGGNDYGLGGTLGSINWFQGKVSPFFGFNYQVGERLTFSTEYNPDSLSRERSYMEVESPWNIGMEYKINEYVNLSAQYLVGNQISLKAQVRFNPNIPPFAGGKELAPVPMRKRQTKSHPKILNNEEVIRKVLAADKFKIHLLQFKGDTVSVYVTNTKFRSTSQSVGRISSTLQRFTSNDIKYGNISFYDKDLQTATYRVNLDKVGSDQFMAKSGWGHQTSIKPVDMTPIRSSDSFQRFSYGAGPYFSHRLFNPDLPLSMEVGLEIAGGYQLASGLRISGALRKSVLTNLTDNERRSNSVLPRVHSDWPLYDFEGQSGHIHNFALHYLKNLSPGWFGRLHAGLLEPFFAGVGGEILYKPINSPIALGIDIHRVHKRDYDMLFELKSYKTTVGHLNFYYDAGNIFDIEINAGRYLAGDWGVTTTVSRKFGSGWEVGGYATLTDVPFDTFGEGSFDKAIYVSVPIDWIISTPNKVKRQLTLRPITRDGGAHLSTARSLYRAIENSQAAQFKREYGRLWK